MGSNSGFNPRMIRGAAHAAKAHQQGMKKRVLPGRAASPHPARKANLWVDSVFVTAAPRLSTAQSSTAA